MACMSWFTTVAARFVCVEQQKIMRQMSVHTIQILTGDNKQTKINQPYIGSATVLPDEKLSDS